MQPIWVQLMTFNKTPVSKMLYSCNGIRSQKLVTFSSANFTFAKLLTYTEEKLNVEKANNSALICTLVNLLNSIFKHKKTFIHHNYVFLQMDHLVLGTKNFKFVLTYFTDLSPSLVFALQVSFVLNICTAQILFCSNELETVLFLSRYPSLHIFFSFLANTKLLHLCYHFQKYLNSYSSHEG